MLTYSSDPLPQIVCPMDEDAIPPNRFCSSPPHSEPPLPLLPLPSITPSYVNDGLCGNRRSGRIQGIKAETPKKQGNPDDSGAAQKSSTHNPSPAKRQRKSGSMVQVSHSKQPRLESTQEEQIEDGFDFSFAAESPKKKTQESPKEKSNVCAAENIVEQFGDHTTQAHDTAKSNMDAYGELAVEHTFKNVSRPNGWVIGPLFQSFKSKVASFTEIVMSPVKLFRDSSPPPSMNYADKLCEPELQAHATSDVEYSQPSDMFYPEAQRKNGNHEAKDGQKELCEPEGAQNIKTVALKYSKKLLFDMELSKHSSEQRDECAISPKEKDVPDPVPLQYSALPCISEDSPEPIGSAIGSSVLFQSSASVSASHESKLERSGSVEEQNGKAASRLKPLPGKSKGNGKRVMSKKLTSEVKKQAPDPEAIDEPISHTNSVNSNTAGSSSDVDQRQSSPASACYAQPDGDSEKREKSPSVHPSLQSTLNDSASGGTPLLDPQSLECPLNPEAYSAAGVGKTKRELTLDHPSQDVVKRKRLTTGVCTKGGKQQVSLNAASNTGVLRGLRAPRKQTVLTNTTVDGEEMLKPARKGRAGSTRAKKTGKGGQEILDATNEAVLSTQTDTSCDPMQLCSLDKSSGVTENNHKGSSSKAKPSNSCKRLKTKPGLGECDVNVDNSMDLETTTAVNCTNQAEQEPLDVPVRPHIKPLLSTSKRRNINTKPRKRKLPNQGNSSTESDSALVSTSSVALVEASELTSLDLNASQHTRKGKSTKLELNQPSKRPRKGFRGAVKPSALGGTPETKQCIHNLHLKTKENQSTENEGRVSMDPVYFEQTPFESNQPGPSSTPPHCSTQFSDGQVTAGRERSTDSVRDDIPPSDTDASNHSRVSGTRQRSSSRRMNIKPQRAGNQRRKCRVLHSRTRKDEEVISSIAMDDSDLATAASCSSGNGVSGRLLRSYSCPEIPSLRPHDTPWTAFLHSPHHSRNHTVHQHQPSHTPSVHHAHKSLRRARRHTVSSVEVEREIVPLCLRKEVYPSRRSVPYDSVTQNLPPSLALSPSTSLSALASCFLSSPLAFLSKKLSSDNRGVPASPSTSKHVSSSASSSSLHPLSPSTWCSPGLRQRTDSSTATLVSSNSGIPLECMMERRQQSEEEDDGEDTSSSSQEFEDVGLREEKALSDSEIKVVQKHEERGKVSSIRIRKTLPKPQNNLTPMGLPKPIRLKKKEFSLEEIYTNKNFSKPPESRLETIFEVPFNRRNGSESWFGHKRVKRFLVFLEVGEARKLKKPLVGLGKTGISSSRTRRGGFPKDEPSLSVQDVNSLLCAKLDQLNLWLIHDQKDS